MQANSESRKELRDALSRLFTAFPLRSANEDERRERKQQYQLYYERLADLPVDVVYTIVIELIDTMRFLPRIGTIRARVHLRVRGRVATAPKLERDTVVDQERAQVAKTIGEVIREESSQSQLVRGKCWRSRTIDGVAQPCGRPFEYTHLQAGWLQVSGEQLQCHECAGEYLKRQGQRIRQQEVWSAELLRQLGPSRPPTPNEIKRLHAYGFGAQLQTRLAAIGAYERRR